MKIAKIAIACIVLTWGMTTEGRAQQPSPDGADVTIQMNACNPIIAPRRAVMSDLTTGKGIRAYTLNANNDKVPECGGELPPMSPVQAFPLPLQIPQLVKIKSSMGDCSGALITRNAVITAAHCIYEAAQFARNVRIIFGFQNGTNPEFGEAVGFEVLTFSAYMAEKQNAHDIAVIKFGPATFHPKYNPYGLAAFTSSCNNLQKMYFRPHYNPAIGALQVQAMAEGGVGGCKDGMVVAGLPSGSGSSGSAVIDRYTRSVFAVHSAGDGRFSYEAPLTKAKICAIYNFLDETEIPECLAGN